jgi:hypothetical protein
MHCKHSTQVVYIVPLQNPQHKEALWVGGGGQTYRKLEFVVGSFRLDFIPLKEGSTLDPSYDTFACSKFSLLFFVFNGPIAYTELLQMNTGKFKIQTGATYTFPDKDAKGRFKNHSETW